MNPSQTGQDSHREGVDWYHCGSAHSQPLNANQKAYAAWALWCALVEDLDRDGIVDEWEERYGGGTMSLTGVVSSASAFFRVWVSEP